MPETRLMTSDKPFVGSAYPGMPLARGGWTLGNAFFKGEGEVLNIGLGRGAALDIFNNNILGFNVIGF